MARDAATSPAEYDYVLIDSRAGVSDTSGICAVQLPDTLVVCVTLNNQGTAGAAGIIASVQAEHEKLRMRMAQDARQRAAASEAGKAAGSEDDRRAAPAAIS